MSLSQFYPSHYTFIGKNVDDIVPPLYIVNMAIVIQWSIVKKKVCEQPCVFLEFLKWFWEYMLLYKHCGMWKYIICQQSLSALIACVLLLFPFEVVVYLHLPQVTGQRSFAQGVNSQDVSSTMPSSSQSLLSTHCFGVLFVVTISSST